MLPCDIRRLKGGMDTRIYRKRIEYYWGRMPLEGYACTEDGRLGMQTWNFEGVILFPFDEHLKNKENLVHQPGLGPMNELIPGIDEFVFANDYRGILLRYRVGDLLKVTALEDSEAGIGLPQFELYSRAGVLINLRSSMACFTEIYLWKELDDSGVQYEGWTARKEYDDGRVTLYICIFMWSCKKKRGNNLC